MHQHQHQQQQQHHHQQQTQDPTQTQEDQQMRLLKEQQRIIMEAASLRQSGNLPHPDYMPRQESSTELGVVTR